MGKLKEWTLFPQSVHVQAENEVEAIAKARTYIQQNLNSLEFEDVVDEGEAEAEVKIDEEEVVKANDNSRKPPKEFDDDSY